MLNLILELFGKRKPSGNWLHQQSRSDRLDVQNPKSHRRLSRVSGRKPPSHDAAAIARGARWRDLCARQGDQ